MRCIWKHFPVLLGILLILGLTACSSGKEAGDVSDTIPSQTAATDAAGTNASQEAEATAAKTISVIQTEAEEYTVMAEQMVKINASVEDETVALTYASADESIAIVNKYGKIIGVSAGVTEIFITASDGAEKTVGVTVEEPVYEDVLRVALNVLYNDSALGCSTTEYGPYVEIYEDGQYTVTFDCTMHLSESAKKMGVTGLDNMTAIFLYDQAVREGEQKVSSVTDCQIRWDSVKVDGQELTLTDTEFKSAMKASGIFDTNDPMNAWDGSAVEEVIVDTETHVLNIATENPTAISITFTIEGLTFGE